MKGTTMNRRHVLLAGLGVLATGLVGCSADQDATPSTSTTPTAAATPVTIGLTYIPNVQFAPFYVAEADGLFAANGVAATLRHHDLATGTGSVFLDDGHVLSYDADAAGACHAFATANPCALVDYFLWLPDIYDLFEVCAAITGQPIIVGEQAVTAPCSSDVHCTSGGYCEDGAACPGVCAALGARPSSGFYPRPDDSGTAPSSDGPHVAKMIDDASLKRLEELALEALGFASEIVFERAKVSVTSLAGHVPRARWVELVGRLAGEIEDDDARELFITRALTLPSRPREAGGLDLLSPLARWVLEHKVG